MHFTFRPITSNNIHEIRPRASQHPNSTIRIHEDLDLISELNLYIRKLYTIYQFKCYVVPSNLLKMFQITSVRET